MIQSRMTAIIITSYPLSSINSFNHPINIIKIPIKPKRTAQIGTRRNLIVPASIQRERKMVGRRAPGERAF